jgi:hypothetical protein
MKSFKDIEFKPHSMGEGQHGLIFFPNGYGVSVVRYKYFYDNSHGYSSYTSNDSEWEVAVIIGNKDNWELCYDTDITNDVIGHLTEGEVDWVMLQVQQL